MTDPAAYLSDDCIVEILSRLPAKHLCRLKCVCRSWRDLISGRVHRLRLARTDAASGFLYHRISSRAWDPVSTKLKFTTIFPPVVGGSPAAPPLVDPAFPFLPARYTRARMRLIDSCNGLLLLRCATDDDPPLATPRYVVCNPGTRSWEDLSPPVHPNHAAGGLHDPGADAALIDDAHGLVVLKMKWALPAALAFDPAVSSHFHVIELLGGNTLLKEVRIYSSETREWVRRSTEWTQWRHVDVAYVAGKHAYLDGFLHLAITTASGVVVASVDAAGQTWRTTRVCAPKTSLGGPGAIGQSQRRLLYADVDARDADAAGSGELSVYALERCGRGAERWVLKHRAMSSLDPSGKEVWFGKRHSVVAIHPDCAVLFLFDSRRRSLIAYDMDRGTARSVHTFTGSCRKYRFFPFMYRSIVGV